MKTAEIKEKIGTDLKNYTDHNIGDMAESHIEAWMPRYDAYTSVKQMEEDLYGNHDPSLEIERAEEDLKRKLNSEECDYLVERFNKRVIKDYKAKRSFK